MISALLMTDDELAELVADYEDIAAKGGLGFEATSFVLVCERARRLTLTAHQRLVEESERMEARRRPG